MNKDEVLKVAGEPSYWMTHESQWRLSNGGNRKGTVPIHARRSSTATVPLYTEAQILAAYSAGDAVGNIESLAAAYVQIARLSEHLTAEREVSDKLEKALSEMVAEKCDYMIRNKLGNPEVEHTTKMARAAIRAKQDPA